MCSYSTGHERLKCIVHLSLGTRNSFFLSLYPINKTSEKSYELISQAQLSLICRSFHCCCRQCINTSLCLIAISLFFIKTLQWFLTFDLTANCYISKAWVQDVDMVTPWEHVAVTNTISNWHLPIQSRSSNSRHFMGKVNLRKTRPQISETRV